VDPSAVTDLDRFLSGQGPQPPASISATLREQAAAARAFVLGDAPPPRSLDPDLARAVCDLLAARGDAERLSRLAVEGDKPLAKAARRGLHALRSRGAAVAVPRPAARPEPLVPRAEVEPEVDSVVSMIDPRGERGVWLCQRDPVKGGVAVYQTVLSDTQGVVELLAGHATRKGYRDLVRDLTASAEFTAVRAPSAYARWLLAQATRRSQEAGRALPAGFAQVRADLGPVEPPPEHPALTLWPQAQALDEAALARLFDEIRELRGWIPDEDTVRAAALKLAEVDESRLLVDERQKAAARQDVLERAIAAYWTKERRALYRERLLDTAYLLHLAARDDDGRTVRAAAEAFAPATADAPPNAFMRRLFERVLRTEGAPPAAEGVPPPPAGPGGLIVSPYERGR
jgi:hypothetical protein